MARLLTVFLLMSSWAAADRLAAGAGEVACANVAEKIQASCKEITYKDLLEGAQALLTTFVCPSRFRRYLLTDAEVTISAGNALQRASKPVAANITPVRPATIPITGNIRLREMKYSELSTRPISSKPSPKSYRRARRSAPSAFS